MCARRHGLVTRRLADRGAVTAEVEANASCARPPSERASRHEPFLTLSYGAASNDPRGRGFAPQTRSFKLDSTGWHPHHHNRQGPEMTSTHRTIIPTRISQCLAAIALISGLTIGVAATAGAKRVLDWDSYYRCINNGGYVDVCCINAGGDIHFDDEGYPIGCAEPTTAGEENVPQEPGQTTPPPVLQTPPAQPSNPLIPTPRWSNSGTLAP
jgi:hypothetical protein